MRPAIVALVLVACHSSDVSRRVGARCDLSAECDERCLAPGPAWPGGFCTIACDRDEDCPTGALCIAEDGGVCAFECITDPDCAFLGQGYGCRERDRQEIMTKGYVCRGE